MKWKRPARNLSELFKVMKRIEVITLIKAISASKQSFVRLRRVDLES